MMGIFDMKDSRATTSRKPTPGQFVLVGFFCITLLTGLAGSFSKRDAMPEFRESRPLARFPVAFSVDALPALPGALTAFFADNFGLRKPLLSMYFRFRLQVLHADLGLPAFVGKNGWMFTDEEIADHRRDKSLTPAQAENIREKLDAWCDYSHQHGAELVIVVGPNKSTIYPEHMPERFTRFDDKASMLDQVFSLKYSCRFVRVDLRPTLTAHRQEMLYYAWGTHWNDRAAQLSWLAIRNAVAGRVPQLQWPADVASVATRPARPQEDSMWQWFGAEDPYVATLPLITAVSGSRQPNAAQPARILAFGDSFLSFMHGTSYLAADPSSKWILQEGQKFAPLPSNQGNNAWLLTTSMRERDPAIIAQYRPNLVMLEVVERYITTLGLLPKPGAPAASAESEFYLTDENWVNGIARHWAGFFVQNTPAMAKKYAAGNQVILPGGTSRVIERYAEAGSYLQVYLSGAPLDGATIGYPSGLRIIAATPAR